MATTLARITFVTVANCRIRLQQLSVECTVCFGITARPFAASTQYITMADALRCIEKHHHVPVRSELAREGIRPVSTEECTYRAFKGVGIFVVRWKVRAISESIGTEFLHDRI